MKLISWNVNGLRAVAQKGFADAFTALDADFFCLQETKLQEGQIDLEFLGYQSFWNYAEKKGYSGTAIYTRHTPLSVTRGIGVEEHDHEGRVLTLEMPDFFLVNVYTPNSQDGLKRLDYRMQWEDAFRAYVCGLAARKGVVICGDMNVAHEEIDLKNPATNHFNAGFSDEERAKMTELLAAGFRDSWRDAHPGEAKYSWWSYRMAARKGVVICGDMNVAHEEIDLKNPATNHFNAGFSDEERAKMTELLAAGFRDSWRDAHPGEAKYSWWSYRMAARDRNVGWRIDYFLVSEPLAPRISGTDIHNEIFGSDHCPVELVLSD